MDVMNVDAGIDYRRRSLEQPGGHPAAGARAAHRAPRDPRAGAGGFGRMVRFRDPLWRPPFAERLPGTGAPVPRRAPVRRAEDGAAPGVRGAALHVADRRVL
ncbi:hypothetical protein G6F66_014728 [Rhizopus arrhizus]|nr:hypothetical protein G6F66_014728 [Rhizopus arrhizus]